MKKLNVVGLLLVVGLLSCRTMDRVDMETYKPKNITWEEIFSNPVDGIDVEAFNTGSIFIPLTGLINKKDPNFPIEMDRNEFINVWAYLIKSSKQGNYVIDTGLSKGMEQNKLKYVSGLLASKIIQQVKQDRGQSLAERLEANNTVLSSIFITHMHFDHTAGLPDLDNNVKIIVGKGEKDIRVPLLYRDHHTDNFDKLYELDFTNSISIYPFNEVLDVYGDNSFFAIKTGGHTGSHIIYLLNSTNGVYLFTGDQVNIKENIIYNIGPGSYSSDKKVAKEAFEDIMEFKKLYPETKLMLGHDTDSL